MSRLATLLTKYYGRRKMDKEDETVLKIQSIILQAPPETQEKMRKFQVALEDVMATEEGQQIKQLVYSKVGHAVRDEYLERLATKFRDCLVIILTEEDG